MRVNTNKMRISINKMALNINRVRLNVNKMRLNINKMRLITNKMRLNINKMRLNINKMRLNINNMRLNINIDFTKCCDVWCRILENRPIVRLSFLFKWVKWVFHSRNPLMTSPRNFTSLILSTRWLLILTLSCLVVFDQDCEINKIFSVLLALKHSIKFVK